LTAGIVIIGKESLQRAAQGRFVNHWIDSKIRVHASYCMLGISLLSYLHAQARRVCPQITVEQMKAELEGIY
jgi:hypothetical protein